MADVLSILPHMFSGSCSKESRSSAKLNAEKKAIQEKSNSFDIFVLGDAESWAEAGGIVFNILTLGIFALGAAIKRELDLRDVPKEALRGRMLARISSGSAGATMDAKTKAENAVNSLNYDDLGKLLDIGLAVHSKTKDCLQEIFSADGRNKEINLWKTGEQRIYVKKYELFLQNGDIRQKLANQKDFVTFALDVARSKGDQPYLVNADCSEMDLDGVDFSECILDGANFKATKLKGAQFVDASLVEIQFSDPSDIGYVDEASRASLEHANFTRAKMPSVVMCSVNAQGANFTDADLKDGNVDSTDFACATMANANMCNANVTNATFDFAFGITSLQKSSVKQGDRSKPGNAHSWPLDMVVSFSNAKNLGAYAQIGCGVLLGHVDIVKEQETNSEGRKTFSVAKTINVTLSKNDKVTFTEKGGRLYESKNGGPKQVHDSICSIQELINFFDKDIVSHGKLYDQAAGDNLEMRLSVRKAKLHSQLSSQKNVAEFDKSITDEIKALYSLKDKNISAAFEFLNSKDKANIDGLQFLRFAKLHGLYCQIGTQEAVDDAALANFLATYNLKNTFTEKLAEFEKKFRVKVPLDKLNEYEELFSARTQAKRDGYYSFLKQHNLEEVINLLSTKQISDLDRICLSARKYQGGKDTVNSRQVLNALQELKAKVEELNLGISEENELIEFSQLFTGSNSLERFATFLNNNGLKNIVTNEAFQDLRTLYLLQRNDITAQTLQKLPKLEDKDIEVLFNVEYEKGKEKNKSPQGLPQIKLVKSAIFGMVHETYRPEDKHNVSPADDRPEVEDSLLSEEDKIPLLEINGGAWEIGTQFDKICYSNIDGFSFSMLHPLVAFALKQPYGNLDTQSLERTVSNPDGLYQFTAQYHQYQDRKLEIDRILKKVVESQLRKSEIDSILKKVGTLNIRSDKVARNTLM